ncbi:unnamed protein product [Chrysodeixis includens]|uniref:Zonadhesin-like n=1 Tax=Chrysodeixis includens TaxID=689277 RepID=A0A9P0C756_CHRIL|nr:unnamed protein product [Chrysodeixis includens]
MWKALVVVAVTASTLLITTVEGNRRCRRPNEVYDFCPAPCPPRECGVNIALILCAPAPKYGDPECKPGCRCADGYLRNKTGICIPEAQCPPECPENEVYDICPALCPPLRCPTNYRALYRCPAPPKPGDPRCKPQCRCADGFLRNKDGKCIPKAQCPRKCPKNEIFDVCPATCPPLECGVNKALIRCAAPLKPGDPKCKPSCRCADGYLRNKAGDCVPEAECPSICGPNEELSPCSNGGCGPWTCSDLGYPTGCVKMDPKYCREGCVCKEGYVKNDNGTCISSTECPECGGDPNAIAGCGNNCGRLCSNYNKEPVFCTEECRLNACDCREGFVYDESSNKCVRPYQCKCNKPNESWDPCPPKCPPQTCESINRTYKCPISPAVCEGECRCDKGYFRNKIGECIKGEDCLKCTGPNEYFSCGGACDNVCATINKQNQTNCPIVNIVCNPMCYCEEGYARDANNICIPIGKCPAPQCKDDERYEECPDWLCTAQTCSQVGFPIACPAISGDTNVTCPGSPACICDYDKVRNDEGKCVSPDQCPSCGGDPNAKPGCGVNCGKRCSTYNKGPAICPLICMVNGCDCKDGFVFDDNLKKCVLPQDCTPICKTNEVYDSCANGGCSKRNCSQLGQPDYCTDVIQCVGGCVCAEGFLKAKNGTCIPEKQCPIPKCPKRERFEWCPGRQCSPQSCSEVGFPLPEEEVSDSPNCEGPPRCVCNDGYVRNDNGKCIQITKCPSCGGDPNAVSGCGTNSCNRLCSNYDKPPVPCPRICRVNACDCKPGFVFDENLNKCVQPNQCTPQCKPGEKYEQCPDWLCTPQTCSQVGFPIACPATSDDTSVSCPGSPACICNNNYVKDDQGNCVPPEQCPSCGGDPNAVSGCGVNCGRLCSNYNRTDVACITVCYPNACDCKKGYVLDENTNKCVLPNQCTLACGANEIYSSCSNGGCGKWNCSQLGQPDLCIDVIECIGGCICKEGYLRTKEGICVPEKECPIPTCPANERFVWCPETLCSPQSCTDVGFPVACPIISEEGGCPSQPQCVCNDGYARNSDGLCVPVKQCPSCGGDPNAVSGCGTNRCNRLCSNYDKPPVPCTKICFINACDCKKGFVFDENIGKCVHPKECSPICGADEVFSECTNGGCQAKNCSQFGKPVPCVKIDPKYCIKGCLCKEGYLRRDDGVCVPQDQCNQCNKPNEYYDACPPSCPPQICESIGKVYHCPISTTVCKGACRCNKGYFRNKIGECIAGDVCLKCTGPNEYFSCGGACDNVCATLSQQNQTNCPIVNIKCNPMCYCEKGYARDNNNTCVPIDKCPVSCGGDPNAKPGCGVNCGRHCSNYNKGPGICPLICKVGGCDCKDGFVFDDNLKKCVLPQDCTPICGSNEVYDSCANGGCQKRNCSQFGQPTLCIDPIKCNGGCVCQTGYLRAENGSCVPENQCPGICQKQNEYYDPCPPICPPQTCDSLNKTYFCPANIVNGSKYCRSACRCKEGFYRNSVGECISKSDCLKCTGPNEHFACGGACDNVCATLSKQNQTNCPIRNIKCNPKCYCDKGYARDDNNICIPIGQCGVSCQGDPNAVEGCGTYCGRRCTDYNKGPVACPAICLIGGCDCKQNYVYDDNIKKCVLPKDCKICAKPHEVFNACPSTCPPQTCDSLNKTYACPIITGQDPPCNPDCVCEKDYYRNESGVCVTREECGATNTTTPPTTVNATEATERLNDGAITVAGEFLYQLASSSPDDNIILSGTSVIIALAQLALFTTGLVLEQLLNFINLRNKDEIRAVFLPLIKSYQNQSNVEFSALTKYYADKNYPLSLSFKEQSKKIFNSTGENVDFTKAAEAAKIINKWVDENTNGKIQDLVKPDMFSGDTRLVLVNAIYFLGNWVYQFNPKNTEKKDFYKSNGQTVTVDMMYQKNHFDYTENDQYQAIKLRYKGNTFSCIVVLPRKKDGLLETIKTLGNPENFNSMIKAFQRQEVEVSIPKMLIKTEMDIGDMLQKDNVTAMFNPNNKNFDGILEKKEDLFVSAAVQQAYLSFNEVGTEAAAATAVIINTRSLKPRPSAVFYADHPYSFYIMFEDTVLFCGSFVK